MDLTREFTARFGVSPEYAVEAPGRVNLIGEHTDYNGCPVLPAAIQYSMSVAAAGAENITIDNTDKQYGSRIFQIEEAIPPFPQGDWGNYVKAGVQAVISHFALQGEKPEDFRGGAFLFRGTIPPAAGLSSSSAIVVASALAFLSVNGREIEREKLAGVLAAGEQYVGTRGGGMDQAVSLFGKEGHAVKIDFNPFAVQPVRIPAGYTFLTAHSLVEAAKTRKAMDRYNTRAAECRLGAELLQRAYTAEYGDRHGSGTGRAVRLLGDVSTGNLGIDAGELEQFLAAALHPAPYTADELAGRFGLTPDEAARRYCMRRDGTLLPGSPGGYKIFQRVRHVLSEWRRVEESVRALNDGEMEQFGMLMTASHASCRDLFEISCPELDRLTAVLLAGGAYGARLTGAGFGGCAVALVPDTRLEACMEYVGKNFYADKDPVLFPCKPSAGARVRFL